MPITLEKVAALFPAGCKAMLGAGLGSKDFSYSGLANKSAFAYCEGWSNTAQPDTRYAALVRTKSGALLTVMATAPKATFPDALLIFREATATLQLLPNRAQ
jgi:hypothetical protein